MVRKLNVLLLALLGLLAGREARVRAQDPRGEDAGLTGAISAEELEALHERPHDRSPAPRGQTVELSPDHRAYLSLPERAAGASPRADARTASPRVGVVGRRFGGTRALQVALDDRGPSAAVIYHGRYSGRLVADPERLRALEAPLRRSIPQETVDAFDRALTGAGVTHEVHRFDADHAFADPPNPRYQSEAAAEAWARARVFLARHLRP